MVLPHKGWEGEVDIRTLYSFSSDVNVALRSGVFLLFPPIVPVETVG
jgi:hypothetical protein